MNKQEANQLLEDVCVQIRKESLDRTAEKGDQMISQQAFTVLTSLFATVMSATLEILDNGRVTRFVCENSKREFFRVKESRRQAEEKGNEKGGPVVYYDIMGDFCFCYFYAR